MSEKVYVVIHDDFETSEVEGVYKTRKYAEEYALDDINYRIEEHEVW